MFHAVRGRAGKNAMVDEVREGLERIFPGPLIVMVFRRDLGADAGWEEERKDRQ